MGRLVLVLVFSLICSGVWAKKLTEYIPFNYEVLFTNPVCGPHIYPEPVKTVGGGWAHQKKLNAYCTNSDRARSRNRVESPEYRILEWINDPFTREIFIMSLSFSNSKVQEALCTVLRERHIKLTIVIDEKGELRRREREEQSPAEKLLSARCSGGEVDIILRGNKFGFGFAHNKLMIVNPFDPEKKVVKLAFGSGNMSSGTYMHHENWHFITTDPKSHFYQAHLCLIASARLSYRRSRFIKRFARCRQQINVAEEEDIKTFFVPGEGRRAERTIVKAVESSRAVDLAAHRFYLRSLLAALHRRLESNDFQLRTVFDDDLYWVGRGPAVGPNRKKEYSNVKNLVEAGGLVRYVETNHWQHLLHHNKFIIFDNSLNSNMLPAIFTGAGNFTGAAFDKNYENYYYITVPAVVQAFRDQYTNLWDNLSTAPSAMPIENVEVE